MHRLVLLRDARLHSSLPNLGEVAAVATSAFGTVLLGMLLVNGTYEEATIWPANGLVLGMLLTSRRSLWPACLACSAVANCLAAGVAGLPANYLIRFPLINLLELSLSLALLRHFVGENIDLSEPRMLARFSAIAVVLAPIASTLVNAALFSVMGIHVQSATFFIGVFVAHALGIITVTPVILALRTPKYARFAQPPRLWRSVLVSALFLVTTVLVFAQSRYPVLFLVYPPLVFMVCLFGLSGGAAALFITTCIAIGFTLHGYGPLSSEMPALAASRILMAQFFVAIAAMLVLPLSAILAARDRAALELKRAKEQLAELARTDALTGLANRRQLDETLERECRRANRNHTPLSLLLLDVDHFKTFNDQYGHQAGDECLREVSEVVKSFGRRPGDLAARYGGEELAVLLVSAPGDAARSRAEALRQAVHDLQLPHAGNDAYGVVTVSIGIATVQSPNQSATPKMLIERADEMLYEAKHQGRNRVMGSL
jgi:diguanylate cyclase (GGDEF)-like protein